MLTEVNDWKERMISLFMQNFPFVQGRDLIGSFKREQSLNDTTSSI